MRSELISEFSEPEFATPVTNDRGRPFNRPSVGRPDQSFNEGLALLRAADAAAAGPAPAPQAPAEAPTLEGLLERYNAAKQAKTEAAVRRSDLGIRLRDAKARKRSLQAIVEGSRAAILESIGGPDEARVLAEVQNAKNLLPALIDLVYGLEQTTRNAGNSEALISAVERARARVLRHISNDVLEDLPEGTQGVLHRAWAASGAPPDAWAAWLAEQFPCPKASACGLLLEAELVKRKVVL